MRTKLLTAALVSGLMMVGTASGQQQEQLQQPGQAGQQQMMRVSELTQLNVRNQQGEELGSIEDVVIDMQSGEVRYAALSYGGFLGIGAKMFAVPFEAFRFEHDPQRDTMVAILNVPRQELETAPGFDQNAWPAQGDERFQQAAEQPTTTPQEQPGTEPAPQP